MTRVLVLAAGNELRGDDAAGPRLAGFVDALGRAQVRTLVEFQFQVEHAVDVAEADLVLFIDAHASLSGSLQLSELHTDDARPAPGSHAVSPAEVLGVARQLGLSVPPVFVLAVCGRRFELGALMSPETAQACTEAEVWLSRLLTHPDAEAWRAQAALAGALNA